MKGSTLQFAHRRPLLEGGQPVGFEGEALGGRRGELPSPRAARRNVERSMVLSERWPYDPMIHKREKRKARRESLLYQRLECLSVCLRVHVFQGVLEIDWGAPLGAPGGCLLGVAWISWGDPFRLFGVCLWGGPRQGQRL